MVTLILRFMIIRIIPIMIMIMKMIMLIRMIMKA